MAQALLTLRDVEVRYGDAAVLKIPELNVDRGEILAVIGPNGSGKSTLIRVMGRLQRPERGEVYFHGSNGSRRDALSVRRRIATVFQEPLLLNATVYENAALGLRLRRLDRRETAQRVRPWLERFGIEHLARRRARSLSGGEAQRTSLVRAMALDPELLLLDEPFSALDPPTREQLLLDLETVLRETGVTTVFVTHDRNEAFMLADRIAVLMHGEILQIGRAAQVFTRPADDKIAAFVGTDTRIHAIVEEAGGGTVQVRFDGGCAEVVGDFPRGERVILCLRPEDIALAPPGTEDFESGTRNHFLSKVIKLTPWGSHYRVAMEYGGINFIAFISRKSFLELRLCEGASVIASFQPSAVHVIRQTPHNLSKPSN